MAGDIKLRMQGGVRLRAAAGHFRKDVVGSALDAMVRSWGEQAVAQLREATPVEEERPDRFLPHHGHPTPGSARESWRWEHLPSQHAVKVTNLQSYVLFLYAGTRPHPIFPKTPGGYLVFFWRNRNQWATPPSVRHPGTQPVPELVAAINRLNVTAEVAFFKTGEEILAHILQPIATMGDS